MGLRGNFLHVGFGGHPLPDWAEGATETTLDIDPTYDPDYVASMVDMGEIGEYDIVYSAHCLEHVYAYEVKKALREMHRVLVDGGTNMVIVPALDNVAPTTETIYECHCGPVNGLDIMYGMASLIEENPYMAHKTGFTMDSLKDEFKEAGFKNITGVIVDEVHSILVTGEK